MVVAYIRANGPSLAAKVRQAGGGEKKDSDSSQRARVHLFAHHLAPAIPEKKIE